MMIKATIIYPKNIETEVITELGKLGIAEIIPLKEDAFKGFKKEIPEEIHRVQIFIDTVEKLAIRINIDLKDILRSEKISVEKRIYSIKELYDEYNELSSFFALKDKKSELQNREHYLKLLKKFLKKRPELARYLASNIVFLSSIEDTADVVEENIKLIGINYLHCEIDNNHIFALIEPPENLLTALLEVLVIYNVKKLEIPIKELKIENIADVDKRLVEISSQIKEISRKYSAQFSEKVLALAHLYKKALITNKIMIAKTATLKGRYTAILQCWVPEDSKKILNDTLTSKFKNIIISFEKPVHEKEPPRKVNIPRRFTPWASLLLQMGYPSHEDLFPWILAGLLWAFMFGYMFPDIGQGLTLILLGILFTKSKGTQKKVQRLLGFSGYKLGVLFITAGVFATGFGLLFGDFFLIEIYHPLIPNIKEHWIKDVTSIKWVIKYALVIGIIELFLAMLLFIIRNLKNRHYMEIIFGEWGLPGLLMFFGLVLTGLHFVGIRALLPPITIGSIKIVLSFEKYGMAVMNLLDPSVSWPMYLFFLGIALLLLGGKIEGNMGDKVPALIEVPLSIVSNTLSFTRLAGFLIGHVAFGLMIEKFAELGGPTGFWGGFIAMNLLVMTLEVLVVSLQSLRLLLYEFSTKWYLGGGRIFRPFRL